MAWGKLVITKVLGFMTSRYRPTTSSSLTKGGDLEASYVEGFG